VSQVGKTNSYDDLDDKPDIPVLPEDIVQSVTLNGTKHSPDANGDVDLGQIKIDQEQADWAESDNSKASFIKNKPDLTVYAEKEDLGTAAAADTGTQQGNIPILGVDGKLPSSVLPPIAIKNTFIVNSEAAMLSLVAEIGDVCVRSDLNKSFILKVNDPTLLANWQELLTPPDVVLSVNGQTGAVQIQTWYIL
jgi:hypothetical protein